jgi:hypothetical protein
VIRAEFLRRSCHSVYAKPLCGSPNRTGLMTLDTTGVRNTELTRLKVSDVDSQRMVIHVQGGADNQDRDVMLSPVLLDELRAHWQRLRRRSGVWLFPGNRWHGGDQPMDTKTPRHACQHSARRAGIKKKVYPHVLRHCSTPITSREPSIGLLARIGQYRVCTQYAHVRALESERPIRMYACRLHLGRTIVLCLMMMVGYNSGPASLLTFGGLMNYLSMSKLGALEISPKVVQFGIFLPGVDSGEGYAVSVKIIHETDQYLQAAQPALVTQAHSFDAIYGDYWSGQINLNTAPPPPGSSAFGQPGRYVYRYVIHSPTRGDIDFIIDPFSREVGVGHLSAITVGSTPTRFPAMKLSGKRHLLRTPSFMN